MDKNIFCFPNGTKKAITFTIDDGNATLDKKFIDIVNKGGLKGTFNLCGIERMGTMTPQEYRDFYRGFEISNHCSTHPKLATEEMLAAITDEPFNPETADTSRVYKTEREGVYRIFFRIWWGFIATEDVYLALIDDGLAQLESVFGKGNITGFVWPFCEQNSERIKAHLASQYKSVRKTGDAPTTLPTDNYSWCYNAIESNLTERAKAFAAIDDEDGLRYLCVGVHSHDFENAGNWSALENFVADYGNRPELYWYVTVGELLEYSTAVNAAKVTTTEIENHSSVTLYAKLGDKLVAIPPKSSVKI